MAWNNLLSWKVFTVTGKRETDTHSLRRHCEYVFFISGVFVTAWYVGYIWILANRSKCLCFLKAFSRDLKLLLKIHSFIRSIPVYFSESRSCVQILISFLVFHNLKIIKLSKFWLMTHCHLSRSLFPVPLGICSIHCRIFATSFLKLSSLILALP
jgi:hypothetical protein